MPFGITHSEREQITQVNATSTKFIPRMMCTQWLKWQCEFYNELKILKITQWETLVSIKLQKKKKKRPHFPTITIQCIINIAVANDEPVWIHRRDQILLGFWAALELRSHLLLSNGGNNGLSGNILGQHLWLITVIDLQQAGPTTLNSPWESVP